MVVLMLLSVIPAAAMAEPLPKNNGYWGIWYMNQPSGNEYRYKYSGGMATYPQQHLPIAVYAEAPNKTFFCYGGVAKGERELLHMVSYFDHATGQVPRPTILLNKQTDDAHENPTMQIDRQGYIWIFSSAHGSARPSYIHRSRQPFSVDDFLFIRKTNFSYAQPWRLPNQGFLFLHTRYASGRGLFWMTSSEGVDWSEPQLQLLAKIALGDYQISWSDGVRIGTAFDYHPKPQGLNARTNLYYLETTDVGRTWRTVDGRIVQPPLTTPQNAALVHDYESEKLLVYLKDLQFDARGRPVILYLTSRGHASGPSNDPRKWHTAHWSGDRWQIRRFTTSDHNYDHGSLYIEPDGTWRIIAPTDPGAQPYGTGGDMVLWSSRDEGRTWTKVKRLTHDGRHNHSYARRPLNAHPDFYALWADGHAFQPSESSLYFTNRAGDYVWRLPVFMPGDSARPEVAW
jgi:hypothetical protein